MYLDKHPYNFSKTKNTINVASDTLTFDIKLTADLMDEIELYNATFKNNKCGKLKMSVPGITDYTGNYIDYSNQEIPIYIDYKKPTISTSLKENKSDYKKYEITCKDNYKLKELYINSKKVKTIEVNEGTYELVVKSRGDSKIELVDQAGNVQGKTITTTFSSPKINESTIKKTTNTGYSRAKMNDKIKITTKFNKKIKSVKLVLNDKIEYYKKDNINSNELEVTVTLSQDLVNKLKNNITNIKTSSGGSVYYILEVTDYQGNTVKYDKKSLIDLDYKGPTISVKKRETSTDGSYYQMVHFELGDNFGIKEIYIDGSKKETYSYNSIKSTTYKFKFQEAGNYKIKVVDYAGNATEQSVQVSNKVKVTDFSAINVSNPQSKTAKKGDTIQVTIKLDQKIKSYGRLVQHYYENKTIAIRLDGTYIYRSGIATDVNNKDEITFNIILNDQLLKILKNNHSTSSEIDLRIEVFGIVNLAGIQTDYSNTLPIKIKL